MKLEVIGTERRASKPPPLPIRDTQKDAGHPTGCREGVRGCVFPKAALNVASALRFQKEAGVARVLREGRTRAQLLGALVLGTHCSFCFFF